MSLTACSSFDEGLLGTDAGVDDEGRMSVDSSSADPEQPAGTGDMDAGGFDPDAEPSGGDTMDAGAGGSMAPAPDDGPDPVPQQDAGVSVGSDRDPFDPTSCSGGACFWSDPSDATCRSTGVPDASYRPEDTDDSEIGPIYLGLSRLWLGQTTLAGDESAEAWRGFGMDLDGQCTNSETCMEGPADDVSCAPRSAQIPFDGQLCRDNTFARLQPIAAELPELGEVFGLSEDYYNCSLWRGSFNQIAKLSGYNGQPDDDQVRLDLYGSTGLEMQPPWTCPLENYQESYPLWRTSAAWTINADDLTEPMSNPGELPDSIQASPDAFVRNGYLIAPLPDDTAIWLPADNAELPGLRVIIQQGVYQARLTRAQDSTWKLEDGLIAGRIRVDDLLGAFREAGLCPGRGLDFVVSGVQTYVEENADVLANGENDPEQTCDALSLGIAFEAQQVSIGSTESAEPLVDCCLPENEGLPSCRVGCGDGIVLGNELCDTAIPEGEPGACPEACLPVDACTPVMREGEGCQAECVEMPIVEPMDGDGCCPSDADATNDSDCPPVCGNDVVEPTERCDPPGSCPSTCGSPDACLEPMLTGDPDNCDSVCELTPITACASGDDCCPDGCSYPDDGDCPTDCGNGQVDPPDETCDGDCPSTCDDQQVCTSDVRTGSAANCNVVCTHTEITNPQNDDGCCPEGASANNDNDCASSCGNGVNEPGEECDDGNTTAGDGCSPTCETETPAELCAFALEGGTSQECSSCLCAEPEGDFDTTCQDEALACLYEGTQDEIDRCAAVVQCGRDTGCSGTQCYCGSRDVFTCFFLGGNGPCRDVIEQAAGTDDLSTLLDRQDDPAYPIGRANALGACTDQLCADVCR